MVSLSATSTDVGLSSIRGACFIECRKLKWQMAQSATAPRMDMLPDAYSESINKTIP